MNRRMEQAIANIEQRQVCCRLPSQELDEPVEAGWHNHRHGGAACRGYVLDPQPEAPGDAEFHAWRQNPSDELWAEAQHLDNRGRNWGLTMDKLRQERMVAA